MTAGKTSKPAQYIFVGLIFFGVLALLIGATVFLSERVYGSTDAVYVIFEKALGVRKGDPVMVAGVTEGYVREIELLANVMEKPDPSNPGVTFKNRVRLRCELRRADADRVKVHEGYKIFIEYASVLGGRVVAIDPGELTRPVVVHSKDNPLQGRVRPDPLAALGELIEENRASIREAIVEIRDTFRDVRTGKGLLGKIISDPEVAQKFDKIVSDIEKVTDNLSTGKGALGMAISDPEVARQFRDIIKNIDDVTIKLNSSDGTLGRLINDTTWADRIDKVTLDVSQITGKLNSPEGTLGKLINTNELHDRIVRIVDKLDVAMERINDGTGLLGKIIHDKEMGDDAKQLVHDIKETFATINRGEGTLGRLVKDDLLIRQLERLFRQVSRSIEDAREAAPIATFSSVLFGAF
ncbi:MAG: MlaD family protein [Planctomycetota bacterium]